MHFTNLFIYLNSLAGVLYTSLSLTILFKIVFGLIPYYRILLTKF